MGFFDSLSGIAGDIGGALETVTGFADSVGGILNTVNQFGGNNAPIFLPQPAPPNFNLPISPAPAAQGALTTTTPLSDSGEPVRYHIGAPTLLLVAAGLLVFAVVKT